NDTIQGDGSIDYISKAFNQETGVTATLGGRVGASRTPGGATDPVGALTIAPSFEKTTDGEDYIEGNAGNDVIFGGLGQDDLVGGGLLRPEHEARRPRRHPARLPAGRPRLPAYELRTRDRGLLQHVSGDRHLQPAAADLPRHQLQLGDRDVQRHRRRRRGARR